MPDGRSGRLHLRTINWERPGISGARGFSARARKTAPGADALPKQLRLSGSNAADHHGMRTAHDRNWQWNSLQKPVAAVCDRRRGVENQSKHGGHRPPLQQKRLLQRFRNGIDNRGEERELSGMTWPITGAVAAIPPAGTLRLVVAGLPANRRAQLLPKTARGQSNDANSTILLTAPFTLYAPFKSIDYLRPLCR